MEQWYGKTDVKSAFRILCLRVSVFWLLVMCAEHPITGEKYYFIDKCLPFGHSISCALFQKFSNAIAHIFKFMVCLKIKDEALWTALTNYLDDFLFLALTRNRCDWLMSEFLALCKEIGIPVATEKTEWGSVIIVFLGILLDGRMHRLGIPEEKRFQAIYELSKMVDRKKANIKEL